MLDQLTADLRTARNDLAAQRDDLDRQITALDQALDALTGATEPARPRENTRTPKPKAADPRKGRRIPGPAGGPFTCGCGREFSRPNGLSRHVRESHGGTPPRTPDVRNASGIADLPPAPVPSGQPTHVNAAEAMRPAPVVPITPPGSDPNALICDDCGDRFRTNVRLRQHQANAHKTA